MAAVAPFALWRGLLSAPNSGHVDVMLWERSIGKRIQARLSFLNPGADGARLATGNTTDLIDLGNGHSIQTTLINAGNPSVFVRAQVPWRSCRGDNGRSSASH